MRKRLKDLIVKFRDLLLEYGVIALVVHYVIFAVVITGFWMAIRMGWQSSSTAADVGTWTAAYILAKITQPLRIVATLAITPLVARWYEKTLVPLGARMGLQLKSRATERPPERPAEPGL
ncbi:MAG: hypothetical protein WD801_13630 [Gemmatimonadaceae bacterium]